MDQENLQATGAAPAAAVATPTTVAPPAGETAGADLPGAQPVEEQVASTPPLTTAGEGEVPSEKAPPSCDGGPDAAENDAVAHAEPEQETELEPEQEAEARERECLARLAADPAYAGLGERQEAVAALAGALPWLQALPPQERYTVAYLLDRGLHARQESREARLQALLSDPALRRAWEEAQCRRIARRTAALPPTLRGGGGAPPASPVHRPSNLREAGIAARRTLHLKDHV